ncbi:tRNA methyltransferase 10 homolog C [Antennarius striatus]|uniref:tRNA methyltransferase 10 homolog C n=1 Tax=Antennarius striatus TaxID=241820 RepID=UPI0035B1E044
MLRLLTFDGFQRLLQCRHFVPYCVSEVKATSFLLNGMGHHRLQIPTRPFYAGRPMLNDTDQPKIDECEEKQTIDLENWKSIMKANVAEDKQAVLEEKEEEEMSLLDETRNTVKMMWEAGSFVPEEITDEQLQELLQLTTKTSWRKYLKFLATKERYKKAEIMKRERKRAERVALEEQETEKKNYDNTFLLNPGRSKLEKMEQWKIVQAMMFGQPLVFDMSYESKMSRRELENAVCQMLEAEGWNRHASDPFHIHYCCLQPNGAFEKQFIHRYKEEAWNNRFITKTALEPIDVFPVEDLVYLTADSPNVLHKFDHSKVYIIGALVDRNIQSGLSLSKAKRLNIATARLPLHKYLTWNCGSKIMTIDQMMRIMSTIKEKGKWEEAFKFVPSRKVDKTIQKPANVPKRGKGFIDHSARDDRWGADNSVYPSHEQDDITGQKKKLNPLGNKASLLTFLKSKRGVKQVWWEDE